MQTNLTYAAPVQTIKYACDFGFFYAYGTWNGGTVTLTWSATSAGTFVPIGSGVSLAADGSQALIVPAGYLNATLEGASSGAQVSWDVIPRTSWT